MKVIDIPKSLSDQFLTDTTSNEYKWAFKLKEDGCYYTLIKNENYESYCKIDFNRFTNKQHVNDYLKWYIENCDNPLSGVN